MPQQRMVRLAFELSDTVQCNFAYACINNVGSHLVRGDPHRYRQVITVTDLACNGQTIELVHHFAVKRNALP